MSKSDLFIMSDPIIDITYSSGDTLLTKEMFGSLEKYILSPTKFKLSENCSVVGEVVLIDRVGDNKFLISLHMMNLKEFIVFEEDWLKLHDVSWERTEIELNLAYDPDWMNSDE